MDYSNDETHCRDIPIRVIFLVNGAMRFARELFCARAFQTPLASSRPQRIYNSAELAVRNSFSPFAFP